MSKKIAVYFSGRCNAYDLCLENLKNTFYNYYDIDFFWSIDEDEETPYYAKFKQIMKPKDTNYHRVDKKIVDVVISSLETRQRNTLSMFYHNYRCTQMIENYKTKNNINYYAIVRFRAEIISDNNFILQDNLLDNTIYIPNGYNYRGVSDRIAYGTFNSMKIYGELFIYIANYVFSRYAIYNPEYLVMFHINDKNMNLIRFPYDFKLHPLRHKVKQTLEETQFYVPPAHTPK
jgi:hypothetical protein